MSLGPTVIAKRREVLKDSGEEEGGGNKALNCLFPVVTLTLLFFRIPTKTFHRTKPLPPRLPTATKT